MRVLRRNTAEFTYRPMTGESETGWSPVTGEYLPEYGTPVTYRGNISPASGVLAERLFGLDLDYTHVILLDNVNADINEDGLIEWEGNTYKIRAIHKSLNVLSIAISRLLVS